MGYVMIQGGPDTNLVCTPLSLFCKPRFSLSPVTETHLKLAGNVLAGIAEKSRDTPASGTVHPFSFSMMLTGFCLSAFLTSDPFGLAFLSGPSK